MSALILLLMVASCALAEETTCGLLPPAPTQPMKPATQEGKHETYEKILEVARNKRTATAAAASRSIELMQPRRPCNFQVQVVNTYEGHCVLVDKMYTACLAGPYLMPLEPGCPQVPKLPNN